MDKSSNDAGDHIVESARVHRELEELRKKMTPKELERSDLILAKLVGYSAVAIGERQKGK